MNSVNSAKEVEVRGRNKFYVDFDGKLFRK